MGHHEVHHVKRLRLLDMKMVRIYRLAFIKLLLVGGVFLRAHFLEVLLGHHFLGNPWRAIVDTTSV